ncbi:MAG: GlxA family transcriptional regulator [Arenicella sp.]|nr:GlxA family transcriptional regulator [Arenicella sp.]
MRVVEPKPVRYGFLLLPNYSMIAVSSAIEVLRMANQLGRQELYQWPAYTMDGTSVMASNGLEILPGNKMADAGHLDVLFVCSGLRVQEQWAGEISRQLHKFKSRHTVLGGLCTGTFILAKAGLLDGYRCTIHWENLASLREMSPEIIASEELFEIDRDRYTAAGGTAPLDMMLQIVKKEHGNQLAVSISEQFMCDRMRGSYDKQRIPLKLLVGTNQPKLTEAVALMEANLEELIVLDDLASLVGISRRQLERLFKKYLDCVPRRYYLDLRLKKARQLLLQTDKSIAEVAIACGFVSAPHFSKSYRDRYNVSPRDERQLRRDKLS